MGIEEKLPSGVLLTSVEKLAGYMRKGSLWPATFGLACCAIEMMAAGASALRPGPLRHGGLPGVAAAGRPDDRGRPGQPEDGPGAAPDLRPDARTPSGCCRWASAPPAAACSTTTRSCRASTTSCPSTSTCRAARRGPEMLIDAILKLHEQIGTAPLGVNRERAARAAEAAALSRQADRADEGLAAVTATTAAHHDAAAAPSDRDQSRRRPRTSSTSRRPSSVAPRHVRRGTAPATPAGTAAWSARCSCRAPRPAVRRLVRRGRRPARARAAAGVRPGRREGRRRPRRADLPRRPRALVEVMRALRDDPALRFEMCMGVSGVHYPHETGRELHAVYPLMSVTHNRRVRVEVDLPRRRPAHPVASSSVYPRQRLARARDLRLLRHRLRRPPGLTRIEMPDDWPGHPQRKDYPLGGIPVEYKGAQIPPPDERRATRERHDSTHVASRPRERPRARSTPSPAGLGQPRRRPRRARRGAHRRQHGPAAPVDPRRAAADPRARGRDGHRVPAAASATCTPASRRTASTATGRRASRS